MVLRRSVSVVVGILLGAPGALAQVPTPTAPAAPSPTPSAAPPPAATAPVAPPVGPPPSEGTAPVPAELPTVPAPVPPPVPPAAPPATESVPPRAEAARPLGPAFPRHGGRRRMPRPWFGGLGYASVAPFFGDISGLESMLSGPRALGASYAAPKSAVLLGGGGGAVLFGHLWIGGKGYGLASGGFDNTLGSVTIGGGGGSFELGYVVVPLPQTFVIPYFGVGGFRAALQVENLTTDDLIDGTRSLAENEDGVRVIAPPGGTRDFEAGFATLDAGIRVMRLMSQRGGGFAAGFELGFLSSFTQPAWDTEGYEVTNAESAGLEGLYVRLNIGGGGFAFR